ncbi:MAG: site-specific integrase [Bacteroidales bacterium]|nr:site-specific integrase [Bacteroidales bacterium]MDD4822222.1 site-specific integrase [Bacteroidales bacterium]
MSTIHEIKAYTLPELKRGKETYIAFRAFDPLTGKLKRKKIKLNHLKGTAADKKKYTNDLLKRIILKLEKGWNPWIEGENVNAYKSFLEVITLYKGYIEKLFRDNIYREETYTAYLSYTNTLYNWNDSLKVPITYIYQMDMDFCARFLEEMYVGRDNAAVTRDNYLSWLKTFSNYCLNRCFLKTDPTAGISRLGKRYRKKQRACITESDLTRIADYLQEKNKHYLLACYILYYCFIRPKEMSRLKLSNFNLKDQSIYLQGDITKNRCDGIITLPAKVIHLMLDLDVFKYPSDYYLFSDGCMPGEVQRSEKQFRDFWSTYVRTNLKLSSNIKFYSLKDSGITNMLRSCDTLTVRDQARHSSILMTDIYTPHDIQAANPLIKNYEGKF